MYALNVLNAILNIYQEKFAFDKKKEEEGELLQLKMLKINCENKENYLFMCMKQTARNDICRKL